MYNMMGGRFLKNNREWFWTRESQEKPDIWIKI